MLCIKMITSIGHVYVGMVNSGLELRETIIQHRLITHNIINIRATHITLFIIFKFSCKGKIATKSNNILVYCKNMSDMPRNIDTLRKYISLH